MTQGFLIEIGPVVALEHQGWAILHKQVFQPSSYGFAQDSLTYPGVNL